MFSLKVLVEHVLQVAQKDSQGPQDNLEVCGKRPSPATVLCYLMGTGDSEGTLTRRAESLLGRARGRDCARQQEKIWFRLR